MFSILFVTYANRAILFHRTQIQVALTFIGFQMLYLLINLAPSYPLYSYPFPITGYSLPLKLPKPYAHPFKGLWITYCLEDKHLSTTVCMAKFAPWQDFLSPCCRQLFTVPAQSLGTGGNRLIE